MTTKITTKHMDALTLHLADALGAPKLTAAAVLGDAPTYADLAAVDAAVVSEALRDAGAEAPPLKRGAAARLFGLLSQGAPTCNRCSRLALRLDGSTWSRVEGAACPVDAGLYEAERVETFTAWTDGREYPKGTTHDADRVPIDSAAIRETRGVSEVVDAALRETGATLPEFLAALVGEGRAPVEALAVAAAPFAARFVDVLAVREFAQRACGALSRRAAPVAAPAALGARREAPDWHRLTGPQSRAMCDVLVAAFPSEGDLRRLARDAFDANLNAIVGGGPLNDRVFELLRWAEARGWTRRLFIAAREANPTNDGLRTLAAQWGV